MPAYNVLNMISTLPTFAPGRGHDITTPKGPNTYNVRNKWGSKGVPWVLCPGKGLYVVGRNLFLLLLNFSAWPCLSPA